MLSPNTHGHGSTDSSGNLAVVVTSGPLPKPLSLVRIAPAVAPLRDGEIYIAMTYMPYRSHLA